MIVGERFTQVEDTEGVFGELVRLLAPWGTLLVDAPRASGWRELTLGLLEGGSYPDAGAWRVGLLARGFGAVSVVECGPRSVVVARGPSEAVGERGLWLLAASGEESRSAAEALAGLLRERDQPVLVAGSEEGEGFVRVDRGSRDSWRGVLEGLPSSETLRGVVHLEGLSGRGWESDSAALREAVEGSGSDALALVQGLYDAGVTPSGGVWFVTCGGQVVGERRGGEPSGSLLWGFGRTVMQELSGLGVRLVDLEPGGAASYELLVGELLAPDRETQVAYRGDRRLVARLARSGGRVELPEGGCWRLVAGAEGSLRELGVLEVEERVVGSDEVRVAVEASGLNFHDVLVGMGLVDVDSLLGGSSAGGCWRWVRR